MGGSSSKVDRYKDSNESDNYNPDLKNATRVTMSRNFNELQKTHYKEKSYKDPRYGNITVYKANHDPNEELVLKKVWINTKQESREFLTDIEKYRKNDTKALCE